MTSDLDMADILSHWNHKLYGGEGQPGNKATGQAGLITGYQSGT